METEPTTRHSRALPELRFSLSLLYVGRLLLAMNISPANAPLDHIDERIEAVTDELMATELLHEAAVLVGDVVGDCTPQSE
ncbi:MAG: hypothetical protein H7Z72_01505 [Bacteroidetes bacterium]|nr:hypothetical protein [Fibrella sp.]